jgi:hypothetical protein
MDSVHPVYILIGSMVGISVLVLIGLKIYMNRAMRNQEQEHNGDMP